MGASIVLFREELIQLNRNKVGVGPDISPEIEILPFVIGIVISFKQGLDFRIHFDNYILNWYSY